MTLGFDNQLLLLRPTRILWFLILMDPCLLLIRFQSPSWIMGDGLNFRIPRRVAVRLRVSGVFWRRILAKTCPEFQCRLDIYLQILVTVGFDFDNYVMCACGSAWYDYKFFCCLSDEIEMTGYTQWATGSSTENVWRIGILWPTGYCM